MSLHPTPSSAIETFILLCSHFAVISLYAGTWDFKRGTLIPKLVDLSLSGLAASHPISISNGRKQWFFASLAIMQLMGLRLQINPIDNWYWYYLSLCIEARQQWLLTCAASAELHSFFEHWTQTLPLHSFSLNFHMHKPLIKEILNTKILWKGGRIRCMKSAMKQQCKLCMVERKEISLRLRENKQTIIIDNLDILLAVVNAKQGSAILVPITEGVCNAEKVNSTRHSEAKRTRFFPD